MFKFGASLSAVVAAAMANTVILQPESKDGTHVAIIMINGASCDPTAYEPLMKEVQEYSGLAAHAASVFVGIPSFIGNTPEPA
jgi:hypothetical protein